MGPRAVLDYSRKFRGSERPGLLAGDLPREGANCSFYAPLPRQLEYSDRFIVNTH